MTTVTSRATARAGAPASASSRSDTTRAAPRGATAGAALELVERARADLLEACHTRGVAERYLQSQLGAMRAAAALVSARAGGERQSGPQSLWDLLPAVAPELTEWAEFFAVTTARTLRPGSPGRTTMAGAPVSAREADDLLRQAETFVDLVCRSLGLPASPPHGDVLVPTAWA
ncbi:MAG TPA: SAV_6107 family HEPN domain-containing protein [Pedococcus sp.]